MKTDRHDEGLVDRFLYLINNNPRNIGTDDALRVPYR